jgi:adenine deaminase
MGRIIPVAFTKKTMTSFTNHVDALVAFARTVPKAELHLHIEGSLEPELMFDLAARNQIVLPFPNVEAVRAAYEFDDLQSFLNIYYAGASVLLTEQDFHDLAWAYFLRAKADGIVHCELFFDPQTHTERGVAMGTVISGLRSAMLKAQTQLAISSGLILCFLRHLSEAAAMDTLEQALPYREQLLGVGLDSSEKGNPPAKFERVFARAKALGLHLVAHAGEEGPVAYIEEALDVLQVERIDHGVRAIDSQAMLARLAASRMPLTVCPLSNVKLRVFETMKQHNALQLLRRGICVTINADDPAYFGGYLGDNFEALIRALPLEKDDIRQLALNSLSASFLPAARKAELLLQAKEFSV